jgi:hypothetical protein
MDRTDPSIAITLTREESLGLLHAAIVGAQEFLGAYDCPDAERISAALDVAYRIVLARIDPKVRYE